MNLQTFKLLSLSLSHTNTHTHSVEHKSASTDIYWTSIDDRSPLRRSIKHEPLTSVETISWRDTELEKNWTIYGYKNIFCSRVRLANAEITFLLFQFLGLIPCYCTRHTLYNYTIRDCSHYWEGRTSTMFSSLSLSLFLIYTTTTLSLLLSLLPSLFHSLKFCVYPRERERERAGSR